MATTATRKVHGFTVSIGEANELDAFAGVMNMPLSGESKQARRSQAAQYLTSLGLLVVKASLARREPLQGVVDGMLAEVAAAHGAAP